MREQFKIEMYQYDICEKKHRSIGDSLINSIPYKTVWFITLMKSRDKNQPISDVMTNRFCFTYSLFLFYIPAMKENLINPDDINYCISTHAHSDHTGNNNLFLKAKHIYGQSIFFEDKYYDHNFKGKYNIKYLSHRNFNDCSVCRRTIQVNR
jgi:mRNA degradation ribonuclease J1/J2